MHQSSSPKGKIPEVCIIFIKEKIWLFFVTINFIYLTTHVLFMQFSEVVALLSQHETTATGHKEEVMTEIRTSSFIFHAYEHTHAHTQNPNTVRTRPHSKCMETILSVAIFLGWRPRQRVGFCWGYSVTTTNSSNRPGEWSCLNIISPWTCDSLKRGKCFTAVPDWFLLT